MLQMAVLPYFIVAVPLDLDGSTSRKLSCSVCEWHFSAYFSWAWRFYLSWFALTFPLLRSASFYSAAMVQSPEAVNFVELYIPAIHLAVCPRRSFPASLSFALPSALR